MYASGLSDPLQEATESETCLLCAEMWYANEDTQLSGELSGELNHVTFLLCQITVIVSLQTTLDIAYYVCSRCLEHSLEQKPWFTYIF
jgi:hypothetical protein